jgi:predicted FMN-binding regulatory protein PaiB
VEGKLKLGQNRSKEDIEGVYQALRASDSSQEQELARLMEAEGLVPRSP